MDINDKLDEYMLLLGEARSQKTELERNIKTWDAECQALMVQHQIEDFTSGDKHMVIQTGTNEFIQRDKVVDILSKEWELDPDQIKEFLERVTVKTEYGFMSIRKVKKGE